MSPFYIRIKRAVHIICFFITFTSAFESLSPESLNTIYLRSTDGIFISTLAFSLKSFIVKLVLFFNLLQKKTLDTQQHSLSTRGR